MREIKFRAWDREMQMVIYPKKHYAPGYKDGHIAEYYNPEENEYHVVYEEDDRFILMQYTGLKDKNGKEIYEGDVLEFSDKAEWYRNDLFLETNEKRKEILENHVKYPMERRLASLDWDTSFYEWLRPCEDLKNYWEVIGNIHENPDLLK